MTFDFQVITPWTLNPETALPLPSCDSWAALGVLLV